MKLTTYNNILAIKCYSVKIANNIANILHNDGYGTKIKLIKAKRNIHPRHFLILVFPPWHLQ